MKPKQKQKTKPLTKEEKEIVEKFKSGLGIYDLNTGMFATQIEDIIRRAFEALEQKNMELQRSAQFWQYEAARFCRNEFFYHDLISKIGEPFGIAAKTSDDGSVQQDVLALKVPELVEDLRARLDKAHSENANLIEAMLSVLCDPEGEPCFHGSDGDRQVIKQALSGQSANALLKEVDNLRSKLEKAEAINREWEQARTSQERDLKALRMKIVRLRKRYKEMEKFVAQVFKQGCNCSFLKGTVVECLSCRAHKLLTNNL